ncbi:tetratricopeptide repeat protein [Candidatus Amarolinea dominans]|uniref:tetratricopeptide repeat protein n=1 Tax=Candidatus Amarolinea dominans TaxID=3140696 RepID=UPI0031355BDC|nr:tetratricopeptide repeat protein [Anaerolineae bacterium]
MARAWLNDNGKVLGISMAFESGSVDHSSEGFSGIPRNAFSSGRYEIHDHKIDFVLTLPEGTVTYTGRITGERLELHSRSRITNYECDTNYWLVRPLLPQTEMEDRPFGARMDAKLIEDEPGAFTVGPEATEKAIRFQAQAWECDKGDDLIGAIVNFDRAISMNPSNPNSYYGRGVMYCKSLNYTIAVADLNRAMHLEPNFPAALTERGLAYVESKDFARAMVDYDHSIAIDPTYAGAHINKGSAYALQGQWAEAIISLDKGIRLDPEVSAAYFNRATAYQQLGDYSHAIEDFRTYLRFWPQDPAAEYARKHLAKLEEKLPDENRDAVQGASPYHLTIAQGIVLPVEGDPVTTISSCDRAIERNPNDAIAYHSRGLAHSITGDLDAAIADFDQALTLLTDADMRANAYNNRGIARARQGNPVAALADFDRAIELDPTNVNAYNNQGNLYASRGDSTSAIAAYNRAAELDPGFPDTFNNRGGAHRIQGNLTAALADYGRAIEIHSGFALPYINRGEVHLDLGDFEAALADLRRCLELCPDASYRATAEELIARSEAGLAAKK